MRRINIRQVCSISNLGQIIVYFYGLWSEDYSGGQIPNYYWLTLIPLTWKIWWAPNDASKWQTGFNSAFKRL